MYAREVHIIIRIITTYILDGKDLGFLAFSYNLFSAYIFIYMILQSHSRLVTCNENCIVELKIKRYNLISG